MCDWKDMEDPVIAINISLIFLWTSVFDGVDGICFWLPFLDAISIKLGGRKWGAKGGTNWQKSNQLFSDVCVCVCV